MTTSEQQNLREKALSAFFASCFNEYELRMFLANSTDRSILPVGSVSFEIFNFLIVESLVRQGFVDEKIFWDALAQVRPKREWEVRLIQSLFILPDDNPPVPPDDDPNDPPPRPHRMAVPRLQAVTTILHGRSWVRSVLDGPVEVRGGC